MSFSGFGCIASGELVLHATVMIMHAATAVPIAALAEAALFDPSRKLTVYRFRIVGICFLRLWR
ncbi:hypothetical protein [Mycolicibacterium goodii]|uniref:Uncharacterized protein n=1 Tax=Mycolicibacterium goodii TaxID=134601 RepID=A0A0K0X6P8_MYCGD|nr:hypothetical protein AFA91_15045 [Mycolicibacterium goodii]